ncbi:ABC transporter permease, partial [Rhizobium sp. YJ-22]|uniref:ABC transporter permease n=1 Tax=Rhizobium sp. YJ-22 TaxID=3037556 RepID=UPI002412C773
MRLSSIPISAWVGIIGIVLAVFCAIFAPLIAPYGESQIVGSVWQPMGGDYLLGTDNLGRDLFSRLIFGARTTIFVALAATILSFSIGMLLSFIAAVTGGLIDQTFSRFNDLMMAIPTLIFALVVLAVLPQQLWILILVMAILDSTRVYRIGRAVALDVAVMEFVEAARLRGEGTGWIIFREILPNTLSPLLAEFGLRFAFSILFLSTLSCPSSNDLRLFGLWKNGVSGSVCGLI